jgi:uncharacterized protein
MRLYLDANVFIYGVEGPAAVREQVFSWIDRFEGTPDGAGITSRISRMECRVRPLRSADHALLARFEAVLEAANLLLIDVTPEVIERATEIRAQHGFRPPDALHLATALLERADAFLTSDKKLARFGGLPVEILQISA